MPQSRLGVHYLIARGQTSGVQFAAVVNTVPNITLTPNRAEVGANAQVVLSGFSASEQVDLRFSKTATSASSIVQAAADGNGGASVSITVPATPFGAHMVEAVGMSSGASARTSLVVMPSIVEIPPEVDAGGCRSAMALRGFAAGERSVASRLEGPGLALGTLATSHSGSTTPRTGRSSMPVEAPPGNYTLAARGDRVCVTVRAANHVRAPQASEDPAPTPVMEPSPT